MANHSQFMQNRRNIFKKKQVLKIWDKNWKCWARETELMFHIENPSKLGKGNKGETRVTIVILLFKEPCGWFLIKAGGVM